MFCHNCGSRIENASRYCGNCGAVINSNEPVKNMVTNVNYDYKLPKNNNFIYVILIILFVFITGCIYMNNYYENYNYKTVIKYDDRNIYIPIGYSTQLGNGDEKEEIDKELYIYNDKVKYSILFYNDEYNYYKYNNFIHTTKLLSSRGYNVKEIKEIKNNNKGMILSKFEFNDEEIYFYIYDYSNNDEIISGFIYFDNGNVDDYVNKLFEILSRITD